MVGYRRPIDKDLPSFFRLEALKRVISVGRGSPPMWWYPSWALVLGVGAGAILGRVRGVDGGVFSFLVYEGDADAARSFVSLVATSTATVTTLTLTLTVVSLQLASSQYSPRLIEHYLSDRVNHVVIALFLGTFACSIATLLNVRSGAEGRADEVPGIGISLLVVLVIVSLGGLVFFVYRLTESMQVESILRRVGDRTFAALGTRGPDEPSEAADDIPEPPDAPGTTIRSRRTGFYAAIDRERCREFEPDGRRRVWIVVRPGDFVVAGTPVAVVEDEVDDDLVDEIERWLQFDDERWIERDFSYGVRSLVDVALKGLSPGVNDPTTATLAIHRLAEVMAEAGRSHPQRAITTDAGTEVYVAIREWDETLDSAVRQIAEYGRRDVEVVIALVRMLGSLAWARSEVDRRAAIDDVAGRLRGWVHLDVERADDDRRRIDAEFDRLDDALSGRVTDTRSLL